MHKLIILTMLLGYSSTNLLGCESHFERDVKKAIRAITDNDADTIQGVYTGHSDPINLTRVIIREVVKKSIPIKAETHAYLSTKATESILAYRELQVSRPDYQGVVLEWPELGLILDPLVNNEGSILNKDCKAEPRYRHGFHQEWARLNRFSSPESK